MTTISLQNISKLYPNGFHAVKSVSLEIASGEFMVLLGPSGCGKSTMLRMIAGLEEVSSGSIFFDGENMTTAEPRDRDVGMVFQNYALYPHLTVFENLAFPLRLRNEPQSSIQSRVQEVAVLTGLNELLSRKPKELSGGQRQRVALGRAIIRTPRLFLFDEPLSNLDAQLRHQMRVEIARLQQMVGVTSVYVTHDQTEAMTMGDRIVLMNSGTVQQIGTPLELYDNPTNRFVAGFLGSPAMNFVRGEIIFDAGGGESGGGVQFREVSGSIAAGRSTEAGVGGVGGGIGSEMKTLTLRLERHHFIGTPPQAACKAVLGIRPEHLSLQAFQDEPQQRLPESSFPHSSFQGLVRRSEYLGSETLLHVETNRSEPLKIVRVAASAAHLATYSTAAAAAQYNDGHPVTIFARSRSVVLFGEDGERL
jgi:ABC-type sugar transport system ATPase subunit